jgi:hypothetical protein
MILFNDTNHLYSIDFIDSDVNSPYQKFSKFQTEKNNECLFSLSFFFFQFTNLSILFLGYQKILVYLIQVLALV